MEELIRTLKAIIEIAKTEEERICFWKDDEDEPLLFDNDDEPADPMFTLTTTKEPTMNDKYNNHATTAVTPMMANLLEAVTVTRHRTIQNRFQMLEALKRHHYGPITIAILKEEIIAAENLLNQSAGYPINPRGVRDAANMLIMLEGLVRTLEEFGH